MKTDEIKITRSFRLTPQTVELLVTAAEKSGWAQGDILEKCIKESITRVVQRLMEKRAEHLQELVQLKEALNSVKNDPSGKLRK
jgi:hypothetical protein